MNDTTPPPSALTRSQKEEAIREKCVEANPEIVAIKEGCRVVWNDDVMTICGVQTHGIYKGMVQLVYRGQTVGGHVQPDEESDEEVWDNAMFLDKPWQKVLGRPIRLADVLLAIETFHGMHASSRVPNTPLHALLGTAEHRGQAEWNLRSDDLSLQSDPTIDLLHSLLSE